VHIDDLKNPEYRKGRRHPVTPEKSEPVRRQPLSDEGRRAKFAVQTARAEFGRFYWNDDLGLRMKRELKKSRQRIGEAAHLLRLRKRNGANV
jgi:hypothetical protein